MAAVCRRPAKKASVNGFALFRRQIMLDFRQQKRWANDEEVTAAADEKWQELTDEAKAEWRSKARFEKMNLRGNRVQQAAVVAKSSTTSSTRSNGRHNGASGDDEHDDFDDGDAAEDDVVVEINANADLPPCVFRRPMPTQPTTTSTPTQPMTTPTQPTTMLTPTLTPRLPQTVRRFQQAEESVLKRLDELELANNPEKRRERVRLSFYRTFTWNYEQSKEALKDQKFYILTVQLLCFDSQANYVPAEIACTQFTVRNGVQDVYCVAVKPPAGFESRRDEIDEIAAESHGLSYDELTRRGTPCDEVVRRVFDMCRDREPNCGAIRFFTPASMYEHAFSAINYLLDQSDLESRPKSFGCHELACLDDLAHALWKFYDVDCNDAPRPFDGRPFTFDSKIDLSQILQSLDVYTEYLDFAARSLDCATHRAARLSRAVVADSPAICARCAHFLLAEILASPVHEKRLDADYLRRFIAFGRQPCVVNDGAERVAPPADYESRDGVAESRDDVAAADDAHSEQMFDDDSTPDAGDLTENDEFECVSISAATIEPMTTTTTSSTAVDVSDAASIAGGAIASTSGTLGVQSLLPIESRGLGRGLHFLYSESALLKCLR